MAHDGPGYKEQGGGNSKGRAKLPPHPEDLENRNFYGSYDLTFSEGTVQPQVINLL